jgi:hypothetical protein
MLYVALLASPGDPLFGGLSMSFCLAQLGDHPNAAGVDERHDGRADREVERATPVPELATENEKIARQEKISSSRGNHRP